jgi:hypothetical protein
VNSPRTRVGYSSSCGRARPLGENGLALLMLAFWALTLGDAQGQSRPVTVSPASSNKNSDETLAWLPSGWRLQPTDPG